MSTLLFVVIIIICIFFNKIKHIFYYILHKQNEPSRTIIMYLFIYFALLHYIYIIFMS